MLRRAYFSTFSPQVSAGDQHREIAKERGQPPARGAARAATELRPASRDEGGAWPRRRRVAEGGLQQDPPGVAAVPFALRSGLAAMRGGRRANLRVITVSSEDTD